MTSLGRLSNSVITAINENTVALASINFDFSLVKVEAPLEYHGVGNALAKFRRENAEIGATHRTARKLGALFESITPHVPAVIAAYGKRVSEILENPAINPSGRTDKHGLFAEFVGVDATSIWAAATSGHIPIAVHLLACLLARAFKDPAHSVSVWAELVLERQREILKQNGGHSLASNISQIAEMNAATQPIPREELRQWDAHARAWLQTADSSRRKECTQLKLILKNINLPVATGAALYTDVIRSWIQAMLGLDKLLNNVPQSATDGAIILAISAWHLYPDLLVLGSETKNVAFADPLFPPAGILTVGITTTRASTVENEGIYWSVALSHYRYYGKPIKAIGEIDNRLTIDDLHLVALGSLLDTWRSPRSELELSLNWFVALWECTSSAKSAMCGASWLENLSGAAKRFLESSEAEKSELLCLIDFGRRRGRRFLTRGGSQNAGLPWFGLRFSHLLMSLAQGSPKSCAIQYLREVAKAAGLEYDEGLITLKLNHTVDTQKMVIHEYSTAVTTAPTPVDQKVVPEQDNSASKESRDQLKILERIRKNGALHDRHLTWVGRFGIYNENFKSKFSGASGTATTPTFRGFGTTQLLCPLLCVQLDDNDKRIVSDCQAHLQDSLLWFRDSPVHFTKVIGSSKGNLHLWITESGAERVPNLEERIQKLRMGQEQKLLDLNEALEKLRNGLIEPRLLWQYLEGPDPYEPENLVSAFLELVQSERKACDATINSLRSLSIAREIYSQLEGATISSRIVDSGIQGAKWGATGPQTPITRSMVFSCIVMMETGQVNLDARNLDQVIALSSGNSLFVLSRLLNDPNSDIAESAITRIVGNVGRPGISLLIPPAAAPLRRPLSNSFRAVTYAPFDGKREDNFKGTSMHLAFTSHEFPLDYGAVGIIDHQVFLVETVVSAYDAGVWVADLNPLIVFERKVGQRLSIPRRSEKGCCHSEDMRKKVIEKFTLIDTWEEILDIPPGIGLIRAHRNWPARLAASIVLSQPRDQEGGTDEVERLEEMPKSDIPALAVLDNGDYACWVCIYRRLGRQISLDGNCPVYLIT